MATVSAYIPCFNRENSVRHTIESIRAQRHLIQDLFVVDDASNDQTAAVAESMGVPVLRNKINRGRGSVRALAMREAKSDLVFSCDAGKVIPPDFLGNAIVWLQDPQVAAVNYGRFLQRPSQSPLAKWRDRHLYEVHARPLLNTHCLLRTGAALLRRSAVLDVGNFNERLRYAEDNELGKRLLDAGYSVVLDPNLTIVECGDDSLIENLERYWRWHYDEQPTDLYGYLKTVWYSMKIMARDDIQAGEFGNVPISLLSPHYRFYRSWLERLKLVAPASQSLAQSLMGRGEAL